MLKDWHSFRTHQGIESGIRTRRFEMRETRYGRKKEPPASIGIVGEEAEYRAVIQPFVQRGDVELRGYPSGRSVLRCAAEQWNAMWLIGIELPDMSGFDLFEMVREHLRNSTVCMVGSKYCEADEVRAYRAGVTMYACRPLEEAWVQKCVELLLGARDSCGDRGLINLNVGKSMRQWRIDDDSVPIRFCCGDDYGRVAGDDHGNRLRSTHDRAIRT